MENERPEIDETMLWAFIEGLKNELGAKLDKIIEKLEDIEDVLKQK